MAKRKITVADIGEVTGYNRDQLRGLLQKLPLYADHSGYPRVAREFTRHDLVVLSVVVRLEQRHGLQRAAIAAVVEKLEAELRGLRPSNSPPFLRVLIDPPSVTYLTDKHGNEEGTVVALESVFQQVDDYLNGGPDKDQIQTSLLFGPSLATHRRHS